MRDQSKLVTVRFNDVGEFLEELRLQNSNVLSPIRTTKTFELSPKLPITSVCVMATALLRNDQRIKLQKYIGQYMQVDETNRKSVHDRADIHLHKIEAAAKALNLEVRAGVYE